MPKSGIQRDKRSGRSVTYINMTLGHSTTIHVPYRHKVVVPTGLGWKKLRAKRIQDISHLRSVPHDHAGFEIARK